MHTQALLEDDHPSAGYGSIQAGLSGRVSGAQFTMKNHPDPPDNYTGVYLRGVQQVRYLRETILHTMIYAGIPAGVEATVNAGQAAIDRLLVKGAPGIDRTMTASTGATPLRRADMPVFLLKKDNDFAALLAPADEKNPL